jgi:hypothetical protein
MAKIVAMVTLHKEKVGGGAPMFFAESSEEMQQTAFLLEKILDASVHDMKNGSMIVVERE